MTTRYADLDEPRLANVLAAEDEAEDAGSLEADDRRTCWTHRAWAADCWRDPLHANRITGHGWCRPCDEPAAECAHDYDSPPGPSPLPR